MIFRANVAAEHVSVFLFLFRCPEFQFDEKFMYYVLYYEKFMYYIPRDTYSRHTTALYYENFMYMYYEKFMYYLQKIAAGAVDSCIHGMFLKSPCACTTY